MMMMVMCCWFGFGKYSVDYFKAVSFSFSLLCLLLYVILRHILSVSFPFFLGPVQLPSCWIQMAIVKIAIFLKPCGKRERKKHA